MYLNVLICFVSNYLTMEKKNGVMDALMNDFERKKEGGKWENKE